ncbi:hypothetical protein F2I39_03990 [Escherichia coli]|nr:hypothetical protein [Escherichia coli]
MLFAKLFITLKLCLFIFFYRRPSFCGVVINSGLSPRSLDEPASLEWRWMREILPILDRFEENDQKCIFLRSNLDCFNH